MYSLKDATKTAIDTCLHVKPGEKVFIAADRSQFNIAYSLEAEAKRVLGTYGSVDMHILDNYFSKDVLSGKVEPGCKVDLPEQMLSSLKSSDVSMYITSGREAIELTNKIIDTATKGKRRHAQIAGITSDAFAEGMSSDYNEVKRYTEKVFDAVSLAEEIHISNDQGTKLKAKITPKYKWVKDTGIAEESDYIELPDGEVFTTPEEVNGTVYTNLLGDNFDIEYGHLKFPLRYKIANSRLQKGTVKCSNEKLKKEFIEYVERYEDGDRVGELALPTNIGLMRKEIKNKDVLLLVEKANVHVALGAPPDDRIDADWDTLEDLESHVDCIIPRSNVEIRTPKGRRQLMANGQYVNL
ncbi:MAG: aminopeptidase [Candidatus Aenigmatarchaeota archaeon]